MAVKVTVFITSMLFASSWKLFNRVRSIRFLMTERYMQTSAHELVQLVDENNQPTTSCERSKMRSENLIHRATYAFIKNKNNLFYVQKRSSLKDYCPSYYDPTPGGVVAAGESYEVANQREIEEEMGISTNTPCEHLFTFYYEDHRVKCFGDAWEMTYDGELKLQQEEVESVHMMSMHEIIERFERGEKFTPDSIYACKEYVKIKGCPPVITSPST